MPEGVGKAIRVYRIPDGGIGEWWPGDPMPGGYSLVNPKSVIAKTVGLQTAESLKKYAPYIIGGIAAFFVFRKAITANLKKVGGSLKKAGRKVGVK